MPNALKGLKVLFTGTLDIDRKTCEATAKKYGAKVISKLEETDYIILGTKPGPKKVETIAQNGLDTISESEFFDMLKTGVPKEKRDRMAAAAADDGEPATKKQKK
jgi:BRCT domain type II-containing protein